MQATASEAPHHGADTAETPTPSLLQRAMGAASHTGDRTTALSAHNANRRHQFSMKHGHPPSSTTGATFTRYTAITLCVILASATAVTIADMVVYQEHIITALKRFA